MPYILSLDAGTTSVRAIVFDWEGRIRGLAQKEVRQIYPQSGWVEHDPRQIWVSQMAVITEVLGQARVKPSEVAGIGITNQRETTIVWDRESGQPVHNAIVWQDRRTAGMCDRLRAAGALKMVQRRTGLLLDPYFSATKLAWILENVPGARKRAERGASVRAADAAQPSGRSSRAMASSLGKGEGVGASPQRKRRAADESALISPAAIFLSSRIRVQCSSVVKASL